MPELSVVIPVYRCTPCLAPLHERLVASLRGVVEEYEIVFVDDGGGEGAWDAITALAATDPSVKGVALSRNFGQHAAITAGLSHARGRWAVVMDCDLQDPPEYIPDLYAKAQEGFDVVYTRRRRNTLSWWRRKISQGYSKFLGFVSGAPVDRDFGALSILSRKVVDAFIALPERDRHYILVLKWLGFRSAEVEYEQADRIAGRSSYSIRALLRVALAGVFFQTTRLLRWVVYLGLVLAFSGFVVAGYFIYARIQGAAYPGWTSLAVFTLVIGGMTIMSVGVVGLYVARIFEEVRRRPLFLVDRTTEHSPAARLGDIVDEVTALPSAGQTMHRDA